MVLLNPSTSNEVTVTVLSAEVGTTLTLTGPAQVTQGQNFNLVATLKRNDTGAAISGATIKYYQSLGGTIRQWTQVGSAVTGSDGKATLATTTIYAGAYYYMAEFAGAEVAGLTLMPSAGLWDTGAGLPVVPMLLAVGALLLWRKK